MIGTPNGYFSTPHSSFHPQDNTSTSIESGIIGENHRNSVSASVSPIQDRKYFPNIASSMTNRKSYKNYNNWSAAYDNPSNYSTPYNPYNTRNNENTSITNAPLNLSLNANDSLEPEIIKHATPRLLSLPSSANSVAQLVLTSGQMVQGIQGAQLFVPTSQGLTRQIVLTIPITHVTLDQAINLSLTDGKIIPTTVGELLKLAMPKNVFDDDVTGEKIINELVKLSERNSVCLAECLKNALKRDEERAHGKSDDLELESENGSEKETDDDKIELRERDEKPYRKTATNFVITSNGSGGRKFKQSNSKRPNDLHHDPSKFNTSYSKRKYEYTAEAYENGSHLKRTTSKRSDDCVRISCEKVDKLALPSTPLVTREEPTSTMNHDTETTNNLDVRVKPDRSSPSDSYDDNDLDDIKEFAKSFKLRRLSMGLTQTQVGQALNIAEGPAYSQSAICSALASHVYAAQVASQQHSLFEKLDITPKSAQKIKPVLERWMKEAEERNGQGLLTEFIGMESSKKRKRRTSFTPQALEILNSHFEHNTHPSGTEITALAHQLSYDREVIRIWFCNKRQALKNTVRMMSKHMI